MKRITLILFLFSIAWSSSLHAVTPAELAERANKSYANGRYAQAVTDWQTLTEIGFLNGAIFNNLGSAYWREGRVGLARLNFLKAVDFEPRNPEFRANLQFTESAGSPAATEGGPLGFLKRIPFYLLSLNFYEALIASAVFSLLFFLLLALGRMKPFKAWKIMALVLLVPWIASVSQLAFNGYRKYALQPAVLIAPGAGLLANPVLNGPILTPLSEGVVLRVLKKQGDFYQVKTLEGQKGWLPVTQVGEVG